jgi:hypothetical protein
MIGLRNFLFCVCCAMLLMSCDRNKAQVEKLGQELIDLNLGDYDSAGPFDSLAFAKKIPELEGIDRLMWKSLYLFPRWTPSQAWLEVESAKQPGISNPVYRLYLHSHSGKMKTSADCTLMLLVEVLDENRFRLLDHSNCSGCG